MIAIAGGNEELHRALTERSFEDSARRPPGQKFGIPLNLLPEHRAHAAGCLMSCRELVTELHSSGLHANAGAIDPWETY